MSSAHILVIEDDAAIRRGVLAGLTALGHQVSEAATAADGRQRALHGRVDLVLLDVRLPDGDGFDLLAVIRAAKPTLPVIMVTARGADQDRIAGLDGGADDYVVKPFNIQELRARIDAVLRRSAERPRPIRHLAIGTTTVDLETATAVHSDGTSSLTEREVDLLSWLATNPNRVVSREELLDQVWGIDGTSGGSRSIDMAIARLREKIGDHNQTTIRTVRGRGYQLVIDT